MKQLRLWIYAILIFTVLILSSNTISAHDDDEEDEGQEWIGHAFLGILSIIFALIVFFTGAMMKGRFSVYNKMKSFNLNRIHKISTGILFVIILLTFVYGLWITNSHGEPIMRSAHGFIGLTLVILTGALLVLNPCKMKKIRKSMINNILGITILIILGIQIIIGIFKIL